MAEPAKRFVSFTCEEPRFLGLVIYAPTGVVYQHQFAGTCCYHDDIEGYFVPVSRAEVDPDRDSLHPDRLMLDTDLLTVVFHVYGDLDRCGERALADLPSDRMERLTELIGLLCYYGRDYTKQTFELDRSRLDDGFEAYVPVVTPDGPGVLVWNNCD